MMEEKKSKKKKTPLEKYDIRGIQTLFRTMSRNHYDLLKMIDNNASIVLTVNSLIISLLLGAIYLAADHAEMDKGAIKVSAGILINCSMASMIFALISMLPHRYIGKMYKNSDYNGSLYASNFAQQSLEEFQNEMKRISSTGQNIYDEMVKDLYFLGKTINGKQIMLLISVVIFLMGLLISIGHSVSHGMSFFR